MDEITIPMPANKTHGCRELNWQRLPTDHLSGVLTIVESVKPTTKVYVSRYLVVELDRLESHRRFQLTKPGGEEVHFVELDGQFPVCQCRGWEGFSFCKHTTALTLLNTHGYLRQPEGAVA